MAHCTATAAAAKTNLMQNCDSSSMKTQSGFNVLHT